MNRRTLALVTGLLLTAPAVAQPPTDHTASTSRKFTLPIAFDEAQRKGIQQVQLLVSRDQGQTWEVHDAVTPDKDHFNLNTKDDGIYWLAMMIRHTDGHSDPADLSKLKPDQVVKYLIDATKPVVRLVVAKRDGDDVVLEWTVDDKHPNDPATTVQYKVGDGIWMPVPADAVSKRTARFKPATPGPVAVRVNVQDSAGNPAQVMKDLPAGTTAYSPPVVQVANQGLGAPTLPPPVVPASPSIPASSVPVVPSAPVAPTVPVVTPTAPAPLPPSSPPAPVPVMPATPPPAVVPAPATVAPAWVPPATPSADNTPPIATSGATAPAFVPTPAPAAPPPEVSPVQHIRFPQFQLQYQLEAGPSGVRQIDLYVTRDDGRTWTRWSQHDGKENPLRVNLLNRNSAATVDGDYGFKLVSVSGANLSDDVPTAGTAPDLRVRVDTAAPVISVFALEADPANRNAVLLKWKATDQNLTEQSLVGIDWSDTPTGNWRPVGGPDAGAVNLNPATVGKVPNRGTYSWQLPANLPSHLIYFRFTAVDPAGNRAEVVAPPQTVDLQRPRARIQSVVTATVPR